jgi:hypothetical protein
VDAQVDALRTIAAIEGYVGIIDANDLRELKWLRQQLKHRKAPPSPTEGEKQRVAESLEQEIAPIVAMS